MINEYIFFFILKLKINFIKIKKRIKWFYYFYLNFLEYKFQITNFKYFRNFIKFILVKFFLIKNILIKNKIFLKIKVYKVFFMKYINNNVNYNKNIIIFFFLNLIEYFIIEKFLEINY